MKLGMIKRYNVTIEGVSPLIWNVMKRELELEKSKLKKNEFSAYEEDRKNWIRKAEFNEDGEVIIPFRWIKAMLVESAKKSRIIPSFETRKSATYTSYLGSVMIENVKPVCKEKDLKEFGQYVGGQGKNSSTKVWRIRPILEKWKTTFTLVDSMGRMPLEQIEELVSYGGFIMGIGDNRVNNFGRFELTKIVEVKK